MLKISVAKRFTEFLRSTSVKDWFHIPLECNPAYCVSRGVSPEDIAGNAIHC